MKLLIAASLFMFACGGGEKTEYKKIPYEDKEPKGADVQAQAWDIVKANCTSCHASQAPIIASKADMLDHADAICKVMKAGSMPPAGPLEAAKSDKIKEALSCG